MKKNICLNFYNIFDKILYNTTLKVNPHKKQQFFIKQSRGILSINRLSVPLTYRKNFIWGCPLNETAKKRSQELDPSLLKGHKH